MFYLVWTPLGEDPLRRFVASYQAQLAGTIHRLIVIIDGGMQPWVDELLLEIDAEILVLSDPVLDLDAYRLALSRFSAPTYCFLNSHSTLETAEWLGKLLRPLHHERIGVVGAGGSFESIRDSASPSWGPLWHPRTSLRTRLGLCRTQVHLRRTFPAYPNPHIRTNAFAMRDEVIRQIDWPATPTKEASWAVESGVRGLSAQVKSLGYALTVVGADGRVFEEAAWATSKTFRLEDQSNLLVHDRRTREYAEASSDRRRELAALAWGNEGLG